MYWYKSIVIVKIQNAHEEAIPANTWKTFRITFFKTSWKKGATETKVHVWWKLRCSSGNHSNVFFDILQWNIFVILRLTCLHFPSLNPSASFAFP